MLNPRFELGPIFRTLLLNKVNAVLVNKAYHYA
jgi:hypothetical protein